MKRALEGAIEVERLRFAPYDVVGLTFPIFSHLLDYPTSSAVRYGGNGNYIG